jgi:MFS family permease
MQQVLRYSAVQSGAAFVAIGASMVVVSNLAQSLTTRFGARPVLGVGLMLTAGSAAVYAQMPAGGRYLWNLLPGMLLGGVGLALCFIPLTIASMTGVQPSDAGVASGLLNTNRQVGGAVGLAVVTTIAASVTSGYANNHHVLAVSGPALTHGFQVGFYVLMGLALAGVLIAALFVESPAADALEPVEREPVALEHAA